MSILLFLLIGFGVGLAARALMPGAQNMGILLTTCLGVAGSFVGGLLVSVIAGYRVYDLHFAGIFGSIVGALLVLAVAGQFVGKMSGGLRSRSWFGR
jgi:uncharacterized membrane protein YeaQ/YmgE (transglycosylase-associated protein family)